MKHHISTLKKTSTNKQKDIVLLKIMKSKPLDCNNGYRIYGDIMTGKNFRQFKLLTLDSLNGKMRGCPRIVLLASYDFNFKNITTKMNCS